MIPATGQAQGDIALKASIAARIDRMARNEIHDGRTPGLAIGVVEDGRLMYARGFGYADVRRRLPMTPATQFFAGGVTMQFTAAAILLLVQDGKLRLDDRIGKYIPGYRSGAGITVDQLLEQTSGLPKYGTLRGISLDRTRTLRTADLLAALDRAGPPVSPGTAYADNPINYLLAGLIVERVSGVPLSDYLEQHVFLPLVMNHTLLAGDTGITPTRATGYTRTRIGFATAPAWDSAWLGGCCGLVTTIYDLAKWGVEMPVLLRVDAVRTMFTAAASDGPTHYGMGWVIDRRGGKDFVWSNGEISGYRAMNALLPDEHIGVIVFSNADSLHGSNVTIPEELGARILDLLVPPASVRLDNAVVARAKQWLGLLASRRFNRSELTPAFSGYLSDELVAREDLAALGPVREIVPISSVTEANGDTLYEFIVRYTKARYHYRFEITADGKIDGLSLTA